MSKRIVFCADGTWDAPAASTNVYLIYKALSITADQVTYYDDGIGSEATGLARVLQGAFGDGLFQKIQDGYTKIAHVYEPGDQIFLFGFSRGAYTARCLSGMIAICGLPSGSFTDNCVTQAFAAYRDRVNRATILGSLGSCGLYDAPIQMIGVWDTVGSLGIPAIFGGIDEDKYGFLDTSLHPDVKNAYQALAIDEQRAQFPATIWTGDPAPGQTIEQVWFSGCHGDVGGGTPQGGPVDGGTRLCDITLGWMIRKAQAQGLTFNAAAIAPYVNLFPAKYALDKINETWAPIYGPQHLRPIPANASIANSVPLRIQYGLTYTPGNLTMNNGALAQGYAGVDIVDATAI
ncbi:MAG TPA: DUF2235 domain-containing protein [Terracidiphilus sp.]|jgi:uncharacterized protein (DUF2235 family)|nr:DUF2235 domain-containing protein [Terracidiphilus sp.]